MTKRVWIPGIALLAFALAGCPPTKSKTQNPVDAKPPTIRSFSETLAVTAIASSGGWLWVGTPRGLHKWDLEGKGFTLIGKGEGLPSEKILALTPDNEGGLWALTTGGLGHELKGKWQSFPAAPVGEFVAGLAVLPGGVLWAGGPDGLARFKDGRWERFLQGTAVTALIAFNQDVWAGTGGRGILRVVGEKVELFGREQGCEADLIRSMAQGPSGPMAIGDGPGGPRLVAWDGQRLWSYSIETDAKFTFEWIRRIENEVLLGSGSKVFALSRLAAGQSPKGPVRLTPLASPPLRSPVALGLRDAIPAATTAPVATPAAAPAASAPAPPAGKPAADVKTTTTKPGAPATAAAPAPPPRVATKTETMPVWESAPWGASLPDSITAVGPDGVSLFIGTRFLGASRVNPDGKLVHYRTYDLAQSGVRLSVACETQDECYVATGTTHAWFFDGKTFDVAQVDPEKGSRVLAVVNQPLGGVLAIHRGAKDPMLRMSTASGTHWTPIALQDVKVPEGVAEVSFATYSPTKHLWLGLHYIDQVGDRVDYGAVEISPDEGKVIYHRQFTGTAKGPTVGMRIPNDLESAWFRGDGDELWFGSRSGAVRIKDAEVRLFTENDGLESEYVHDILEGPDGKIWVATNRGVGTYDGTRWSFPGEGYPLRVRATSLARDRQGQVFVGTKSGLLIVGPRGVERIGESQGLLEESILNLAVDKSDRIWVLTEKGLSLLSR